MQLIIGKEYNEEFVYSYIPKYIYRLVCGEEKRGLFNSINTYLKKVLGIDYKVCDIIKDLLQRIYISNEEKYYVLDTNNVNEFRDTKRTFNELVNLIEFGNIEVKGTHILDKIFSLIHNLVDTLWD